MDALEEKHIDTSRGLHYRYYASSGSSSPYTLLLVHGFPDSANLYQFAIPHLLKTGLNIIVPDCLGYGGTSKPTDPAQYEWSLMTADLVDILEHEKITSGVIPVGHDWGSALAQRFYMLQKSRCVGLITLNVALLPPSGTPFDVDAINKYTEQALGYPSYAYWKLFLPESGVALMESRLESMWHVMHGDAEDWMKKMFCTYGAMQEFLEQDRRVALKPYRDGERLMREWIEEKRQGGLMAPTCWYRAMAHGHQAETEKTLDPKVVHPYLFVGCDGDAVCRTDAIEGPKKAGLVPDLTVKEVQSGHWCLYEKPDEVASIMVDWLTQKGFAN